MADISFTDNQKDALKEIGNICAGNAATALSQLLDRKISIVVGFLFFPHGPCNAIIRIKEPGLLYYFPSRGK